MRKEKEITTPKGTSRSLFEAINNSEVLVAKQVMEEGTYTYVDDNVIKSGPDLIEGTEEEIQHRKYTEEDEDMEYNIQQISKVRDLSPRHTNSLKIRANKGKTTIPLQAPDELDHYRRKLAVYTRCNALYRLELWDELASIVEDNQIPWIIGGDFNVIVNEEEKLGGLNFT
ncbi:hypothetical protein KY285_005138 [Solanum tuberosum]|nr:hypothetical protein KY284_005360 [Solanum tuberosum]KAH0751990.1 hypothetical protein KY285_005138 [Solanum tuberosum]